MGRGDNDGEELNNQPCIEHDRRILRHEVPLINVILRQLMRHTCRQAAIPITPKVSLGSESRGRPASGMIDAEWETYRAEQGIPIL